MCYNCFMKYEATFTINAGRIYGELSGSYPECSKFDSCPCNLNIAGATGSIMVSKTIDMGSNPVRYVQLIKYFK